MSEIEKFEGDLFWNDDDTESAVDDPESELDNCGRGEIVEFQQAKRLPNFFGVSVGKDSEPKYRFFTTQQEAEEAIVKDKI